MVDKYPATRAHLLDLIDIDRRWQTCLDMKSSQFVTHDSVDYQHITDIAKELGIESQWHNESMEASFEARQMLNELSHACRKRGKSPPSIHNQTTWDEEIEGNTTNFNQHSQYHTFGRQTAPADVSRHSVKPGEKKPIVRKLHLSFEEPSAILETTEQDCNNSTIVLVDEEYKPQMQEIAVEEASFFRDNAKDQSIAQFTQLYKDLGIQEDQDTRKFADFLYQKNRAYFEAGNDANLRPIDLEEDHLGPKATLSRITDAEVKLQEMMAQKRSFKFGYELEKFHSAIFGRIEEMISQNDELRRHNEELEQANNLIEVYCGKKSEESVQKEIINSEIQTQENEYDELLRRFRFMPRQKNMSKNRTSFGDTTLGTKRNRLVSQKQGKSSKNLLIQKNSEQSKLDFSQTNDQTSLLLHETYEQDEQDTDEYHQVQKPLPSSLLPTISSIICLTEQANSKIRRLSECIFSYPYLNQDFLSHAIFKNSKTGIRFCPIAYLQSYFDSHPHISIIPLVSMQAKVDRYYQATLMFPVESSQSVVCEKRKYMPGSSIEYHRRIVIGVMKEFLDV